jgi:GT2 family glycosyltransferase
MTSPGLSVAVVVPTYNRPEHVRSCLRHIAAQTIRPVHTVVVDSSPNHATYQVVTSEFPEVDYLRTCRGAGGHAEASRDLGLRAVTADVVVFVDDDSYAEPDCVEQLLGPYGDPAVGGVGGRVRNGIAGEESVGADRIGLFMADGTLTGNFAANPGRPVKVDHLLGACMSWRREVLVQNGGIHDDYPGLLRGETDIAFRAASAGWQIVYQPSAVVRHVSASYHKGHRFDVRYTYHANRNHLVLLMRNLGPSDPRLRRYFGVAARGIRNNLIRAIRPGPRNERRRSLGRRLGGALAHSAATASGLAVGAAVGYAKWRSRVTPLCRHRMPLEEPHAATCTTEGLSLAARARRLTISNVL